MARLRRRRASADLDAGFTLIEVIVALMLLTIVLMAGGAFMIRSISTSSTLTGRQGAVMVANQVLEQIHAVNATFDSDAVATRTSPLVYGRGKSDVVAQWAASGLDVSQTTYTGNYTGTGTAAVLDANTYQTASSTPTVPLQRTIVLGGRSYTVNALIGTCVQAAGAADCGLYDASMLTYDELFRVVVRVTWAPGAGRTCTSTAACSYGVSTLIDPTPDPTFNASRKPVANPDAVSTPVGTAVNIGVSVNDSGDFAPAGAVTILTGPTIGSLSLVSNVVVYTPPANTSGKATFTYTVTDQSGRVSNEATVTVSITPIGVADTASTTAGSAPITVAVLGNDRGTGLSLVSLSTPSIGSAAISGTGIVYTVPATTAGTATVTYTAKDSSGQQYTGTLTITVAPVPGPAVVPLATIAAYSVFSGSTITSSGATSLNANLGLSPAGTVSATTAIVVGGATHNGDSAAAQARSDLTVAYNDAAGRAVTSSFTGDLKGKTFTKGVYKTTAALALTGTLTLDGGGDPNAVFIFQIGGAMSPAAGSVITLTNGAKAANVFWQVTGATSIGAGSSFSGTILSAGAITVGSGTAVNGRALSYAAITLAANVFTLT